MYSKKSMKPPIVTVFILSIAVLGCGFLFVNNLNEELGLYASSQAQAAEALRERVPSPFVNSAIDGALYAATASREDALYYFEAPEGFAIISHSEHWNREMLELLYEELKLNAHGDEIEKLYEIVVYPHEDDEGSTLATYSPGITSASFFIHLPSVPSGFSVDFPIYTGRINIYGGDVKTTIESIAGSLSHEYGHHYTFYYMFDQEMRRLGLLGTSEYGRLREAQRHGLITNVDIGEDYFLQRHLYIIETAAEDYVTLMGSPTTRQVVDYLDVKQLLDNPELEHQGVRQGERNAFPQENMMLPLAIDVPGLAEHFYGFIGTEPRVQLEDKEDITLQIARNSEQYDLITGPRNYVHYTITWNTPYQDAIYTVACYDPYDYTGWGIPIKTVRPGAHPAGSASAVIGEYVVKSGNMIHSMDDGLAEGIKVFYVVAQLPDGTYYVSELQEFHFG